MAECGIEKYDKLPARVDLIDVDGARAALNTIDSGNTSAKCWVYHPWGIFGRIFGGKEKIRQSIIEDLENARKIHNGEVPSLKERIKSKIPV